MGNNDSNCIKCLGRFWYFNLNETFVSSIWKIWCITNLNKFFKEIVDIAIPDTNQPGQSKYTHHRQLHLKSNYVSTYKYFKMIIIIYTHIYTFQYNIQSIQVNTIQQTVCVPKHFYMTDWHYRSHANICVSTQKHHTITRLPQQRR